MRWKPDGRAGIEDRRTENDAPTKKERKGTLFENVPQTPAEEHDRGMLDHERDNYYRRTHGLPEKPLHPSLRPAVPPENWNGVATIPPDGNFTLPSEPTNPYIDSALDPKRLAELQANLRSRLMGIPRTATAGASSPLNMRSWEQQKLGNAAHDTPIKAELVKVRRVQKSGLLDRIAALRALRNK